MAKVYLEDSELTNIGDAIRAKGGTTELLLPSEMPAAIDALGGGQTDKLTLSGNLKNLIGYDSDASPFWQEHLHEIINPVCVDVTDATYAFTGMKNANAITEIHFINKAIAQQIFSNSDLTVYPKLSGQAHWSQPYLFGQLNYIETIPAEVVKGLERSYDVTWNGITGTNGIMYPGMFNGDSRLKDVEELIKYETSKNVWTNNIYMYFNCMSMKKAWVPFVYSTTATVQFQIFYNNMSLEEIEFLYNPDLSPAGIDTIGTKSAQTFDLTKIGFYLLSDTAIVPTSISSIGFTDENRVKDEASYQALKNTANWWSSVPAYSKWNVDGATKLADTIPICQTTSTIKFNGQCGSGYGKAISDMSDATIAKYTEKNWTVSIT